MLDEISLNNVVLATFVAMFVYVCLFIGWRTARSGRFLIQTTVFVSIAAVLGWYLIVDYDNSAFSGTHVVASIMAIIGLITLSGFVAFFVMRSANSDTQYRVRKSGLQAVGAVFSYLIGHTFVGFGIPEASMAAGIAAISLGLMGFQA